MSVHYTNVWLYSIRRGFVSVILDSGGVNSSTIHDWGLLDCLQPQHLPELHQLSEHIS